MTKTTKTEAAKAIAIQVRVFARKANRTPDMMMVEEIISEYQGRTWNGMQLQEWAKMANHKTVLRMAQEDF